jgi:hypothetical protein
MHGIPEHTDFSFMIGRELESLGVGLHSVSFAFDGDVHLTVEGAIEVVHGTEHANRYQSMRIAAVELLQFIGDRVVACAPISSRVLELTFERAPKLRLIDDDEHYESFVLGFGERTIVV